MRVLLLNQCFHPDHVATAQHLTDLGVALIEAGHEVTVVASSRGYDDPARRFPARERFRGIDLHRVWTPGLGKRRPLSRFIDFGAFWAGAAAVLATLPRHDVIVCLTSPPLISTLGTIVGRLRGTPVVPWVMDLNPDEAVAAGWLRSGGSAERALSAMQNWSLSHAARVVALDRFMADRLRAKGVRAGIIHVDPPWSHDQAVRYDPAARSAFRSAHGLDGKFVVMYSGNHSPCHPLDAVLRAAEQLRQAPDGSDVHFLFVGGGSEFQKVQAHARAHGGGNITCLPYQPIEALSGSLSSADLHLVMMGDAFVGIVHPCKVYNILSLGVPFLFVGPAQSHVADLAARLGDPRHARTARNGDVAEIVRQIREARAAAAPPMNPAARALGAEYSHDVLCPRLIAVIAEAARAGAG